MSKKPFKVSARTARLIGRENVAHADGAIIELLKNCYDADSKTCILYFDIKYNHIPEKLSPSIYRNYYKETLLDEISFFELCYQKFDDSYILKKKLSDDLLTQLEFFLKKKNKLFIVDSGEGMTEDIIDKHWMTIGTNNKLEEVYTPSGRIKSGAKGIGRFALDRLGSTCKMITKPHSENSIVGYEWDVNWEDFEKENINIQEVQADFKKITPLDYQRKVNSEIPDLRTVKIVDEKFLNNGTLLKISGLRDWWTDSEIKKLCHNLEVLSPPDLDQSFDIYLFDKRKPNDYGKINNEIFDDFDYKLYAKVNKDKTVNITITRNEFNLSAIDKSLFNRHQMQVFPYDYETFTSKTFDIVTNVFELLPNLKDSLLEIEADRLGEFDFTFYFLKLTAGGSIFKERFFYRDFDSKHRKKWFESFGGIKIFRDNFRVRPYGEVGNTSFDWLALGERKAQSPAGIAKPGNGYRVAPNQVAGTIHISRIANLKFNDKSSREGFQENETFEIFKNLIRGIINKFEIDRSTIGREMDLLQRESNEFKEAKDRADDFIIDDENSYESKTFSQVSDERNTFKKAYDSVKRDYEDTLEEIRILRALATTGLMVTSFAHEFSALRNQMERRTDSLHAVLSQLLDEEELKKTLLPRKNPFHKLKSFKYTDLKLKHWLDFSLAAIRKDKRNSGKINFQEFVYEFERNWQEIIDTRQVDLKIEIDSNLTSLNAYIIDIESLFNNLLINSFDAFDRKGFKGDRRIDIKINSFDDEESGLNYLNIDYADSGPGIAKYILNPYNILKAGFTTKLDGNGQPIGTGIGMWIVNSVVEYYDGALQINIPEFGFKINIKIPFRI